MNEVTGTIDHRILLNFRIDPEVMQRNLPAEFTPKIIGGYAIGGICQVSLSKMRPKGMPSILGASSHNVAHRIAVETSQGEGVYVPRRDTSSMVNTLAGGRLFAGVYSKANFDVSASDNRYAVEVKDNDGQPLMSIKAKVIDELPSGSIFKTTEEVSDFFKTGNLGWSPKRGNEAFDAIELETDEWNMVPLLVDESFSAHFSDTSKFPVGSVEFDNAMIMRNLKHSWIVREHLCELCR